MMHGVEFMNYYYINKGGCKLLWRLLLLRKSGWNQDEILGTMKCLSLVLVKPQKKDQIRIQS